MFSPRRVAGGVGVFCFIEPSPRTRTGSYRAFSGLKRNIKRCARGGWLKDVADGMAVVSVAIDTATVFGSWVGERVAVPQLGSMKTQGSIPLSARLGSRGRRRGPEAILALENCRSLQ